jgi:glucuronyl/N-acetylglucosaminyl transferase EXT1
MLTDVPENESKSPLAHPSRLRRDAGFVFGEQVDFAAASWWMPAYIKTEPQNRFDDKVVDLHLVGLEALKTKSQKNIDLLRQLTAHVKRSPCSMSNCFDASLCDESMKVFAYPDRAEQPQKSPFASSVLAYFRTKANVTSNPKEACLFVPSVDVSDRDPLSPHFIANAEQYLYSLPHWNNGTNHLLFNLFPGTFPNYYEFLDFDTQNAILVKSCMTIREHRQDFDISFPHISPVVPQHLNITSSAQAQQRPLLASFKGKRYLYGVGTESRDRLRALDNDRDVIVLTTCVHNKDWQKYADQYCEGDNKRYETFDYEFLLSHSRFSFVPRGRRINSFRFLEVLAAASIPVVLGDRFLLPFHEVIDWDGAAIYMPEVLGGDLIGVLRQFSAADVSSMRQRVEYLYQQHFSSLDRSLGAVLSIIRGRIFPHLRESISFWNGPLVSPLSQSTLMDDHRIPLAKRHGDSLYKRNRHGKFTAILLVHDRFDVLFKTLQRSLLYTTRLDKVIVVMNQPVNEPPMAQWPQLYCPIEVYRMESNSLQNRFLPFPSIRTNAILSLDDDVQLDAREIEFGFEVWSRNRERLVGWPSRRHLWTEGHWEYDSNIGGSYSMILTGAAFFHRKYLELYATSLPKRVYDFVDLHKNCEDIAFNFLVANITRQSPVKVSARQSFPCDGCQERKLSGASRLTEHLHARSQCISVFAEEFGYQPLVESWSREDPAMHQVRYDPAIAINRYPLPERLP